MSGTSLQIGTSRNNLADIPREPTSMTYGLNYISSSDAGRTLDAACTMHVNRIAEKVKLGLTWNNPPLEAVSQILKMTNPETFYVRYLDPKEGRFITKKFYSGDKSAPYRRIVLDDSGTVMTTLSFDIIEV